MAYGGGEGLRKRSAVQVTTMSQFQRSIVLSALLTLAGAGAALAKTSPADKELVDRVSARIIAVADPVEGWLWPPVVTIVDEPVVNAYATLKSIEKDGKSERQPMIFIYQGYLDEVVQGKEDRLAEVFGHELSHILLKHVALGAKETPLVARALGREDEIAADVNGIRLALKAGFNYGGVVGGLKRMWAVGPKNSSFERLLSTHPSDTERLAVIDEQNRNLWQAMSAFENGCYFLMSEQYDLAERCFRQVVKDFPGCYEAWANLGYARLMLYCDKLTPEDLRAYDLGQLVVGGFYRRPGSIEVRGRDEKLWFDAVGALREALRLKSDLILVKANLAVAYLVHPTGKDVGPATELFEEVTAALKSGEVTESLDPVTRAALLINAGVSEMASGRSKDGETLFREAELLLRSAESENRGSGTPNGMLQAVRYNRALMQSASGDAAEKRSAVESLGRYLSASSTSGAWWALAYDRYAKLCEELQVKPKSIEELTANRSTTFRVVTHVNLEEGKTIAVTDPVEEAVGRLSDPVAIPVIARSSLKRMRSATTGIDIVATDRQIIAICVRSPEARPVELRAAALGGETRPLRVGMSKQDLEAIVGEDGYDFRELVADGVDYRFYRALGLAVRIEGGVVREIVIAQVPQESGLR